jgi:hypothetical protein
VESVAIVVVVVVPCRNSVYLHMSAHFRIISCVGDKACNNVDGSIGDSR